jgi:hypothetical protein
MTKQRETIFNGIVTGIDKTDQKIENASNSINMDISIPGKMSSFLGNEKQHSTAKENIIVSIVQLGDSSTIVIV